MMMSQPGERYVIKVRPSEGPSGCCNYTMPVEEMTELFEGSENYQDGFIAVQRSDGALSAVPYPWLEPA